jgi:hypothetical protein
MKKIFIRSPYWVEVDEANQTSAKIEIFLWNKGTTEPINANYTFTKNIASTTQTKIAWNVANYAKEFIKPIAPITVSVPTEENVNTWCYMKVKRYSNNILLDTETFVCLNGYTQYLEGYNQDSENVATPLFNYNITFQKTGSVIPYVNIFLEASDYHINEINYVLSERTLYKIPLTNDTIEVVEDLEGFLFNINSNEVCEPKYTPITCTFINRYGGWQYLTFFKANIQSIETTSKEFSMLPASIDYNVLQGQKRVFNGQGKQKIKCNTGWVDENYFELIQDLLLSEVVLLNNKPAIVKSQSADYKTSLKDKNINYEIEFEYNFGLINDVI